MSLLPPQLSDLLGGCAFVRSPLATGPVHATRLSSGVTSAPLDVSQLTSNAASWEHCTVSTSSGTWHKWRLGPFTTSGDVNFWISGGPDADPVNGVLVPLFNASHQVGVSALYQLFFTSGGTLLGTDTHISHHQNLFDESYDIPAAHGAPFQEGTRSECYATNTTTDAGCQFHDFGDFVKPLVGRRFLTDAFLQDIRPYGSLALEWTHEFAYHVVDGPFAPSRVLSEHQLWNPGRLNTTSAGIDFALWELPGGDAEFLMYYAGRWPTDGRLNAELSYLHIHTQHEISFLFEGEPSDLGLGTSASLRLRDVCTPLRTSTTSAGSNAALRAQLYAACPACFGRRKLICVASNSTTRCENERPLTRGMPFTMVSFYASDAAVNQNLPSSHHITWFLRYESDDGEYHFTQQMYNQLTDDRPLIAEDLLHMQDDASIAEPCFPQPRVSRESSAAAAPPAKFFGAWRSAMLPSASGDVRHELRLSQRSHARD